MPLNPYAVAFFMENGSWSRYATETEAQGRARSGLSLARAERKAKRKDWYVTWDDDWTLATSHAQEFGEAYADMANGEPNTCQTATLYNSRGDVLASLGCIDDADKDYRRVVEAELAAQALGERKASS